MDQSLAALLWGKSEWTKGPESSSKVSRETGIGPWMAPPSTFKQWKGPKWETDFLPLLVLTRRRRSTGKPVHYYWNCLKYVQSNFRFPPGCCRTVAY